MISPPEILCMAKDFMAPSWLCCAFPNSKIPYSVMIAPIPVTRSVTIVSSVFKGPVMAVSSAMTGMGKQKAIKAASRITVAHFFPLVLLSFDTCTVSVVLFFIFSILSNAGRR